MYRYGDAEAKKVAEIIASGSWFRYYGSDKHCQAVGTLEERIAEFSNAKHVLATSSGTGAIISSFAALGVGPGDEVIVPGYTFIATAAAAIAVGAVPVIAEIDETMTLDLDDVRKKISPRTKVIAPVHMLGHPSDMDGIMALAKEHNLLVLEDGAQSVGASYKGKVLGTIGDIGCWSLQWHKTITSGEGGCVLTNNANLADRATIYHDDAHCFRGKEDGIPSFPGVNYRMSEIAGAVGLVQTGRLRGIIDDLRKVRNQIVERLGDMNGFSVAPSHDPEGDAGTVITLQAPSAEAAQRFCESASWRTIFGNTKTDWHVYYHWDYILEKRSASGSGFPWKLGDWESPVEYSKDMCPNTIDVLSRSMNFNLNPDMGEEQIDALVQKIKSAIA
jgi:dTDP-4-amino-4,6-dideoxygalactose transaminase